MTAVAAAGLADRAALNSAMLRELADAAMDVFRIVHRHAAVQAEELAPGAAAPASASSGPSCPRGPSAPSCPRGSSAPQPPRLRRRIDWMTMMCRLSAEVRRVVALERRGRLPRGRPASPEELRPGRVRRLIGDAILADPDIAALDRKLAAIAQRIRDVAIDLVAPAARPAPACLAHPSAAANRQASEPVSPRRIDWSPVESLRRQIRRKLREVRGPP